MTNSIATSKCSSVLSSGSYSMTQNRYTDESKEYIFVKVTDSAYRALEEYQRNESNNHFSNGQGPKIQFNGNSGVIYFPALDNNENRKFGFTIDDVEVPLQCIQQTPQGLDAPDFISYRMRIHGNDDIYDTTRTKMTIAEETKKSKRIREIEPNQTDIGRKVKKPVSSFHHHLGNISSSSSYLSNSINRKKSGSLNNPTPLNGLPSLSSGSLKLSSRSSYPSQLGGSVNSISDTGGGGGLNNNRFPSHTSANHYSQNNVSQSLPSLTSASSVSPTLAIGIPNSYASAVHNASNQSSVSPKTSGGGLGSVKSRLSNINTSFGGGDKKLPDISRHKIRERLIHLLALRPFKKPELYARLQKEGLRDGARSLISNVLKDISTTSCDSTYNLRRQMWNDVNENWPYYTEQEFQQLKRRKLQNLTPSPSSDAGSSRSGQSSTLTHAESPPPMVCCNGNGNGSGLKRTSLECDRYDQAIINRVQSKKQRISHFKKDTITASTAGAGVGKGSGSGLSTIRPGYSNNNRNKIATTYSPQDWVNTQAGDNTDLSFNVLSNSDGIMSDIDQSCGFGSSGTLATYSGASRKSNMDASSSSKPSTNLTENHNLCGSNNTTRVSPKNSYNVNEVENNSKLMEKTFSSSGSSTPYTVNFVPESSKSSSGSNQNGNVNSSSTSSNSIHRHQSPSSLQHSQQQYHYKMNSAVQQPQLQHHQHYLQRNNYQQQPTKIQQTHSSYMQSTTIPLGTGSASTLEPLQILQYKEAKEESYSISPTMQQLTSAAPEVESYDFSNFSQIRSIEQRCQYKTEFERDYGEYNRLRERMDKVRRNFEVIAEQLHRVPQGCKDYEAIKQQIVNEYERINNEDEPRRDRQRFDYLHAKLAHKKQLVTDYD